MRHGSINWFAVYGSLIMLIFLVSGATWCISPGSFVKAHRALFPKNPVSSTEKWEPGTKYLSATEGFLDYAVDNNNRKLITKPMVDRIEGAKDLMFRGMLKVDAYTPN